MVDSVPDRDTEGLLEVLDGVFNLACSFETVPDVEQVRSGDSRFDLLWSQEIFQSIVVALDGIELKADRVPDEGVVGVAVCYSKKMLQSFLHRFSSIDSGHD